MNDLKLLAEFGPYYTLTPERVGFRGRTVWLAVLTLAFDLGDNPVASAIAICMPLARLYTEMVQHRVICADPIGRYNPILRSEN